MDITIASERENKLLDRKELNIRIGYKGATPNRKEIREAIGRKIAALPELVAVRKIVSEFGKSEIKVETHVYTSKEAYAKYEPDYVQVRSGDKAKKEKKKKEKKAPAKKQ